MRQPVTIENIKNSACSSRNTHLWEEKEVKKKRKYLNNPVEFDGRRFDSTKERDRYISLRMLLVSGIIENLECQVEFILQAEGEKVASYFADFVYKNIKDGKTVVEDVKSPATRRLSTYRLKKRLMMACYGIEIKEV